MTANVPNDLILISEVAASYGVGPDAIRKALKAGGKRVYKVGRLNAAPVESLYWYGARRERKASGSARRPAGWVGVDRAAEQAGMTISGLHSLLPHPELNPVRVGRLYFFDPAELKAFRQAREGVPSGWISLVDLARTLNASDTGVARIARRAGMRTRRFYATNAGPGTPVRICISNANAEKVAAQVLIPLSYPGHLKGADLGRQLGMNGAALRYLTRLGLPHQVCRRGYNWYDPAKVQAWLVQTGRAA